MRVFPYILTTIVTIFVVNIALSFSLPAYRNILIGIRTSVFPSQADRVAEEEKNTGNERLIESLERIDKHIESLSEMQKADSGTAAMGGIADGGSGSISIVSGDAIMTDDNNPKEPNIPLSWLFLAKIMPEVVLKKTENSGFFSIQVMGKILYNTYVDDKRKIRIYAFQETYDTILLNMKLTSNVYSINETDQFFWYTFFLNPVKKDPKDTTIRFVTALEGRAIGIEVPKSYYPTLKKMLLKK